MRNEGEGNGMTASNYPAASLLAGCQARFSLHAGPPNSSENGADKL